MFGACINIIMPRAARFTGNALQTIFPPITRAAQGVDGWSEGCWAHTRGCGSPEGCDVGEGTTGGASMYVACVRTLTAFTPPPTEANATDAVKNVFRKERRCQQHNDVISQWFPTFSCGIAQILPAVSLSHYF